jgi:subtilisin family serine protease
MAAPHVAGVMALMKSIYPALTPAEFDALLASGELTDDAGPPGRDDFFGHGIINARKAVEAALALQAAPAPCIGTGAVGVGGHPELPGLHPRWTSP